MIREVQLLKSKIKTITFSTHKRNKRGLINGVGTLYKWLFGTMDDIDRQEIVQHFEIIDTNNHNAINNLNKQIHILMIQLQKFKIPLIMT